MGGNGFRKQENFNERGEEEEEDEVGTVWCECVIVTNANDLHAKKQAKQVLSIRKSEKTGDRVLSH